MGWNSLLGIWEKKTHWVKFKVFITIIFSKRGNSNKLINTLFDSETTKCVELIDSHNKNLFLEDLLIDIAPITKLLEKLIYFSHLQPLTLSITESSMSSSPAQHYYRSWTQTTYRAFKYTSPFVVKSLSTFRKVSLLFLNIFLRILSTPPHEINNTWNTNQANRQPPRITL